ncbi:FAD-binding oxidoreductase [Paraconexibacter algicola]|uniref:FAD-binding oxidoreductase n=1 Tax=Paraconexibacter algicola TaxID=2133960 RepID=A0A2T4UHM5_9ACTN|nr:FAD-binding oxidoreductase [Paraconexibacter algicola]PTL58746.1 FAD-binding oxidoreductase [Paraconexibacter algicola]
MSARTRSWWGWGYDDGHQPVEALRAAAPAIVQQLGFGSAEVEEPARLADVLATLPAPRVPVPAALRGILTTDGEQRIRHAQGKSYLDTVRAFRGVIEHPVDAVARPRDEHELEAVLAWAADARVAVIPYGGGTSVCGGVEPRELGPRFEGAVSVDLGALDALHELDDVSRAARIGAGASGPRLEEQLRAHGMTMRFFPQSFELSTLGGWIATRAGGHFATVWTHVDDLVESVRAITPIGAWASRRLPGSGAGPSPDRLLLGSEGTLGVITEAWVRVQPRPEHRASRAVRFPTFLAGADAVRALSQSGLLPANCRLVDPLEAQQTGAGDGTTALLVLGFESTDHDVADRLDRGLAICREHGGSPDEPRAGGAVSAWRDAFLAMPYLRDTLMQVGVLADTFETAITWDRFPAFHETVVGATRAALGEPCRVTCRFTHVYPDGPAPYYTVIAPARRGDEVAQWQAMKDAASRAIVAAGGTITHHHAVGRDHRPYYETQRPDVFAAALRGAKAAIDPAGVMNPGVLLPAEA